MKFARHIISILTLRLACLLGKKSKIRFLFLSFAAFGVISGTSCDNGPFVSCYDPVEPLNPSDTVQIDSTKSLQPSNHQILTTDNEKR